MRPWLSKGRSIAFLALIGMIGYILISSGLGFILGSSMPTNNPIVIGIAVALLVLILQPALTWLRRSFPAPGLGSSPDLGRSGVTTITEAIDVEDLSTALTALLREQYQPRWIHLFTFDPLSQRYGVESAQGFIATEVRFHEESQLVRLLESSKSVRKIDLDNLSDLSLIEENARLALLKCPIFVPLHDKEGLLGWVALGHRQNGEPYLQEDLESLTSLAEHISPALSRLKMQNKLAVRIQELKVIERVAQAVNFASGFDDLLELIATQVNIAIPNKDFRIALFDKRSKNLAYQFLSVQEDRLKEDEGQKVPDRTGLLAEVARSSSALVVDDYQGECISRGLHIDYPIHAWMGVPIYTDHQSLGAMGVGNLEPGPSYSEDQYRVFNAIADLATGAIVKARLHQETEVRAEKLAALNQVASNLGRTLELDPLLQTILTSGVDLLESELGSLVMVDETTGELVFQVASGPIAGNLTGRRLPPGVGVIGRCIDSGESIILIGMELGKEVIGDHVDQSDFQPRSLLIAPLRVKGKVIGALEVMNRQDQTDFENEDLMLLSAFASQAAVAIENARLYTLTDQALEARVEELSVIQRIDRELNARLDADRSMGIALQWSLQYTQATTGFFALLEDSELSVMVADGYQDAHSPKPGSGKPTQLNGLLELLDSGEPFHLKELAETSPFQGFNPQSRSLIAMPVLRENRLIGALVLESPKSGAFESDHIAFLTRLVDHASIAITNSMLYAEIQEANQAKSEFVSYVSHELKTPMTSIKGYSDLLIKGSVGDINEMQANFLSTIRSNVDRMEDLVSDLTDVSRIEAGLLRLEFQPISIGDLVEEVLRINKERIDAKNLAIEILIHQDLPNAWGDRNRVIQVLTNLISNATKYTPPGGNIAISVEQSVNKWDESGAPRVLHIEVFDTGIGITPEDQDNIFVKFFRSEDHSVREVTGTGLGLSITKHLVELQGGTIWFESEYGQGSKFHFTVPISEVID